MSNVTALAGTDGADTAGRAGSPAVVAITEAMSICRRRTGAGSDHRAQGRCEARPGPSRHPRTYPSGARAHPAGHALLPSRGAPSSTRSAISRRTPFRAASPASGRPSWHK
jgi:hypothetical protein